jgi:uncharacterized protein (DUF697 family)
MPGFEPTAVAPQAAAPAARRPLLERPELADYADMAARLLLVGRPAVVAAGRELLLAGSAAGSGEFVRTFEVSTAPLDADTARTADVVLVCVDGLDVVLADDCARAARSVGRKALLVRDPAMTVPGLLGALGERAAATAARLPVLREPLVRRWLRRTSGLNAALAGSRADSRYVWLTVAFEQGRLVARLATAFGAGLEAAAAAGVAAAGCGWALGMAARALALRRPSLARVVCASVAGLSTLLLGMATRKVFEAGGPAAPSGAERIAALIDRHKKSRSQ